MIGNKDPRLIPQQQILDMLLLSFKIHIDMNRCKGKYNVSTISKNTDLIRNKKNNLDTIKNIFSDHIEK